MAYVMVETMKPVPGHVVLYKTIAGKETSSSEVLPALVCKVWGDGSVDLQVFNEYRMFKQLVKEGEAEGCWHWPSSKWKPKRNHKAAASRNRPPIPGSSARSVW
jgi:hypothetical protein